MTSQIGGTGKDRRASYLSPRGTSPDPSAVDEAVALGATVVGEHEVPGASHRWTVMQDLEGNKLFVAAKSFTGWA